MSILSVKSLVCVLWSRPGTPLIGPHGKRYASGTEYEVASARESWKAAGGPETMIYLHDAPAQIRQFPDSEFQKMVDKLKALKGFVAEYLPRKSPSFARPCFPSRLVLVIDQLEELFTLESITPEARANFIVAIAALARSGRVAVLAILRSDFFEKCAELPLLAELSKGGGLHHLLPPNPLEIGQMIREPAVAAGLQFEIHPETKQFLDERLRDVATRNPEALKQCWRRFNGTKRFIRGAARL